MILAVAAATALTACGSSETETTPVVCLEGAQAYLRALDASPTAATLEGGVPISDCFTDDQGSGELSSVGSAVIEAATRLSGEAAADPGGDAATELGFLVGSVESGTAATGGIHTDLVRRLDAAARPDDPDASFRRSFAAGYAAARAAG